MADEELEQIRAMVHRYYAPVGRSWIARMRARRALRRDIWQTQWLVVFGPAMHSEWVDPQHYAPWKLRRVLRVLREELAVQGGR